jgi:hypothetical protein
VDRHPGNGTDNPTFTESMATKVRNRFTLLLLKKRRRVSAREAQTKRKNANLDGRVRPGHPLAWLGNAPAD